MKKLSLRLFVVYLGLLIWGVIIIIHSFSLVHQRRDAYLGKFDDTLTVGNRYFQIKQGNKQGFRGNVYADGGEIISTTIPIYGIEMKWIYLFLNQHFHTVFSQKLTKISNCHRRFSDVFNSFTHSILSNLL